MALKYLSDSIIQKVDSTNLILENLPLKAINKKLEKKRFYILDILNLKTIIINANFSIICTVSK